MIIHVTGRTGHFAMMGFGTCEAGTPRQSAQAFLKALAAGTADARPLAQDAVDLQDDFRPFLKKKLRLLCEMNGLMILEEKVG